MFAPTFCLVLTISSLQFLTVIGGRKLDDYISHYEELHYDARALHASHMRHKRSIDKTVNIQLNAFNRTFHLELTRNTAGFAPDLVVQYGGRRTNPDLSFLYGGSVKGEQHSQVTGAIIEGVFRGSVHIPSERETYHVEKSQRFFDEKPVFHSVIYKESDMNFDPYRDIRAKDRAEAQEAGTCGYTKALKWMKETVASAVKAPNRAKRSAMEWQEVYSGRNMYTSEANSDKKVHIRKKRSHLGVKSSCFLSLTSDRFFWDHFLSKAGNNRQVAKDEILAFFHTHVDAINKIYQSTNFTTYDGSMSYKGVQFTVQKTTIMTDEDCQDNTNPLYSFCEPHVDVSNFLNMNSLLNHDTFCLAYVFTNRDFTAGTLGLAWVGAATMASGGICERYNEFQEGDKRVNKSLNTGIVTIVNYGKYVPSKVSQLTFAHEVGHNFGSPHDSGIECAPYGTNAPDASQGNYIMFASATMGDKPHNSLFSSCSKDNITRVIDTILHKPGKFNCFKESGPFCGNGILEKEEQCDCGFEGDCDDPCCIPRESKTHDSSRYCMLATGAICSPSQGPCCNSQCKYITEAQNFTCRYKQECADEAKCNGTASECPASVNRQDGTYCQNFGFTCKNGECAGSLCEAFNWTECTNSGPSETKEEQIALCTLGCRTNSSGIDTGCVLSNEYGVMDKNGYTGYRKMVKDVREGREALGIKLETADSVQLAPGSPCNNFQGYCDVFYRCRGVESEGPLSRLKNLIFDPKTLQDISNWIQEHWWAVLLMGIGLVLAMGLFIKFCAVHTPSSNPKAKPARKLSETMTLRRRRNQNRQPPSQAQPQQVRYPQNPQGPPPPYPGSSSAGSHVGPPHGHGKKGKGRKSKDIELGRV